MHLNLKKHAQTQVYFVKSFDAETGTTTWHHASAEKVFEQGGDFISADSFDDAYAQMLAQMPENRPGYVWAAVFYDSPVIGNKEILARVNSVEELVAIVSSEGSVLTSRFDFKIGQKNVLLFDAQYAALGFTVECCMVGPASACRLTWSPKEVQASHALRQSWDCVLRLQHQLALAVPKVRPSSKWYVALDTLITLYNAIHGANSHRKLKAFQSLLASWPLIKNSTSHEPKKAPQSAFEAWLDAECRVARKKPIAEDQQVEFGNKLTIAGCCCNPKYREPIKKGKGKAAKVALKA